MNKRIWGLFFLFFTCIAEAKVVSIKQFGIVPNAPYNQTSQFEALARYINQAQRNIEITFPKGVYIIGRQQKNNSIYLEGVDILSLQNCSNITIKGTKGTKFIYEKGLKFGSFDPNTGLPYQPKMPFYNKQYIAQLGCAIRLSNCTEVTISQIEIDGNQDQLTIGGNWGDTGTQLWHYGVYIVNGKHITLDQIHAHHMGLDGISVSGSGKAPMDLLIKRSTFEYNGRQGFSWIGGSNIRVEKCSFSFNGRGRIKSAPAAGIDIEAEGGNSASQGIFIQCQAIHNGGCGLVADSGPSKDMKFESCTFWGIANWSAWVQKPAYTFSKCNFYGSFVHGFITTNTAEATRFYTCTFEDKSYQGQTPYGGYLLESDGRKLMIFDGCTFIAHQKKVMWYNGCAMQDNEKAIFTNCTIRVYTTNLPVGTFYTVMRKMNMSNVLIQENFPADKKYYFNEDNNIKQQIRFEKGLLQR